MCIWINTLVCRVTSICDRTLAVADWDTHNCYVDLLYKLTFYLEICVSLD